ncbi:MAG: mechanosensitive ion channel family protein [Thermoplasmata archaeon]|nr:mechanosensitive ion channel family protein [Thermoplasmata archaeon]
MAPAVSKVLPRLATELGATLAVAVGLAVVYVLVAREFCTPCFGANPPILFRVAESGGIILVGYLLARSFGRAIRASMDAAGNLRYANTAGLVVNIILGAVLVLALLFVFGVTDFQSLLFGSAFAGIVVGLASQTILSNIFAGLIIVFAGPFRPGDHVGLSLVSYTTLAPSYPHEQIFADFRGTVREVGLLYTVLRLDDGRTARIPNGVVYSAVVTNWSQTRYRLTRLRLTLPTSLAVADLESAVREFVREFPATSGDVPTPRLFVVDVGATTWDAVIEVWSEAPRDEPVTDALLRHLIARGATRAPEPTEPGRRPK